MPLSFLRRLCRSQAAVAGSSLLFSPGVASAGEPGTWSGPAAGGAMALSGLAAGLLVWWLGRRRRQQVENQAAKTVQRMTALIEHTDCLLWEARVKTGESEWQWRFTLHASVLSRELFGAQPVKADVGLWNQFNIPERMSMDERAAEAMRSGLPGYEQQFRLIREGQTSWMSESVSITPTGSGEFWLVGLVIDVTGQKEAELTHRARQEQLQQLLSHTNCMLWQADVRENEDGAFDWQWFVPRSELYRRIVGEDPVGKAIMPWGAVNVPEFSEMEGRSRQAMRNNLPGYQQEFRVTKGDKTWWMHEQALITPMGQKHWKLEGVVIDISARRQAEEAQRASEKRLEHLLERADCTIWHGQVTRIGPDDLKWDIYIPPSQLYRRMVGAEPGDTDGFDWSGLGVPEFQEMRRRSRTALFGGAPSYEQVFHLPRPERDLWLAEQVSISPAGQDAWDLIGVITDVTARYEAEEARRASEAQLQQVLELADCMVWHATAVQNDDATFNWSMNTHRSVLYRRVFGDVLPDMVLDWRKLNVPELPEMEARFARAFADGSSGYEQVFRVVQAHRVLWLREIVTLMRTDERKARLVGVITDITAQREAEEGRRAGEAQMEQMLATADCLLWQARVFEVSRGELRWVLFVPRSRLYREIFGSDPGDPAELRWPEVISDETNREIDGRAIEAILDNSPGYEQEFRAQRGSREFWLHEQVWITRVAPTEWQLVGVITDLSERRGAEQAVRASEIRYRSLFQHTPVAIVETDFSEVGRWLDELRQAGITDLAAWLAQDRTRLVHGAKLVRVSNTNDTALQMLRAKKPSDFRRRRGVLATPEAMNLVGAALIALWEKRNTLETELKMRDFEGGLRHMNVRWWVAQSDTGLDLRQSVLVFVDLTELKQADAALATEKERLAVTLRAMAEGVVTTDVAGMVQFINPAAATLTQWGDEAIGQPISRICVLENDRTGVPVAVPVGAVAHGDAVAELPALTRLVSKNSQRRLVNGCCAPIHSAESVVIGMVFVFRDVTEHERLEQELVRATRLESVGILAGGIAHDFNNILTGVMGNLALAQLDIDPKSDTGARLADAEKATLRARDLTQQLLTFAKGGEPVRSAVRLDTIVQDTANFALHGSNVKPQFQLATDLWPADADGGQIGRVVQNLVINAVQAMPGGGTLRLTAYNEKISGLNHPGLVPGDYVHIAIADTGEGIKPEHISRIFDPYFTTKQSGSGLGLAAVYSIIKKHSGHIDVESQVNEGTTFRIWLPAMDQARAATTAPMPVTASRFEGRVLFMDDEDTIRRMAAIMLQRLGFVVECASDGAEAVEKYRRAMLRGFPFTLVIMDLTVPGGIGGREAIGQLREIDPQVRAIVSSGYSSDPVLANFRAHGFCGVMAKPYKIEDFIRAIRETLAAPRS